MVVETSAAIVAKLNDRLGELTRSIQRRLTADIVELRDDPGQLEILGSSIEGNVDTVLHALRYQIPIENVAPPTAALEYARRLAQQGVPMHALVRSYRLGHESMLQFALGEITSAGIDPTMSLAVYEHITTVTFGYIDWISQQVVVAYEDERERWLEHRNNVRAVRVREVLETADVDLDAVTSAIRYPMRRTHLALILWLPEDSTGSDELVRLERFLREIAESLQTQGSPLFVAADRMSGWGWIPLQPGASPTVVADVRRFVTKNEDSPWLALGLPLPGVEGFQRSHRQAQRARNVAIAAGPSAGPVTAASDPGLSAAALLGDSLEEARIWVQEVLGPLASDTEGDSRSRATLRVFLRHGSSYKAAADELNLHFNSVKYRVQRAVERRGRPIGQDRLDVELALLVCEWFGTSVLQTHQS
jgi:hypothetical protein